MNLIYQEDQITLKPERITDGTHPTYGDTTVFHDVVVASEMVQRYDDGFALKDRDELKAYADTMDFSCAVVIGGHPEQGIISDIDQISGHTMNHRFVKNLKDPKTKRPNRAGVRADIEVFNKKVAPELLVDMMKGVKPDVSIGFFYTKDETAGDFNGEAYDYVQRKMLHNHLAAGIDNGRCPSPYCGLGADEIQSQITGDPFAGFENFNDCVRTIMKKNPDLSKESAIKICGKLKAQHEDELSANTRQNIKALAREILATCSDEELAEAASKDNSSLANTVMESLDERINERIEEIKVAEILRDPSFMKNMGKKIDEKIEEILKDLDS